MLATLHSALPRAVRMAGRAGLLIAVVLGLAGCGGSKRVETGPLPAPREPVVDPGEPVTVRVGMVESSTLVVLVCEGPWSVRAAMPGARTLTLVPGDSLRLTRVGEAVVADGVPGLEGPGVVVSATDRGHPLHWDGRPWRGEFHVFPTPLDLGLTAANVLDLEAYLAGVVPREIGGGREPRDFAAVAAQSVAARNYTLERLGQRAGRGFDVYSDVRDQAYGGMAWEDSLCNEALAATAGLVLRHGGRLVPTYYHSTCGGHTAAIDEVWPYAADAALQGRPDGRPDGRPWCSASRYATWRAVWTWPELTEILRRSLPVYLEYARTPGRGDWGRGVFVPRPGFEEEDWARPGELVDLVVTRRTPAGRVDRLVVETTTGTYVVRGDRTRWVLQPPPGGPSLLRSSWFELDVEQGRSVVARGRGWGHGIGLCQMGAVGRSRAGQGFREILTHYYPGADLEPVAGGTLP